MNAAKGLCFLNSDWERVRLLVPAEAGLHHLDGLESLVKPLSGTNVVDSGVEIKTM